MISSGQFQAMLRASSAGVVLAIVLCAAGLASIIFFFSRWRGRNYSTLLFGILSALYGARLFLDTSVASLLLGVPERALNEVKEDITFILLVPMGLFFAEIFRAEVKKHRWLWYWVVPVPVCIAVSGLVCNTLVVGEGVMHAINHAYVICTVIVVTRQLVLGLMHADRRSRRELVALTFGFSCIGLFALHTNLRDYGVPGPSLEPIGFFIFVCSLGYVVMLRTARTEQQLLTIRKELEIARQIQASILPTAMPLLSGVELAGRYLPMTEVGGDFYEFIALDDKRLGVLIADVSGHGVPAALVASMVKVAVSTQVHYAAEPAKMLSNLNRVLHSSLRGQFVTAAYVFIDAEKQTLSYAGAGHPPLLVTSASDGRFVEQNGLMLGLFPDAEYTEVEIPWISGDRCLLYTDGVVEAENAAQDSFGMDRLRDRLEKAKSPTADSIADGLVSAVSLWGGAQQYEQQDDITMVVIQFGSASVANAA